MLFIIISIFIYFIISFGFGSLINKYFQVNNLLSLKLLNGILFIGIISLISSIVIPLNIIYEIVISLAGLILAIYYKFWRVEFKFNYSFIILAVITCLIASMDSFIYDTYSYYLPTIRFLDDFGLLKGLGNFDFNLGQTSLWHIIQASTNNTIDLSYKLNAYLIIIYLIYIYENNFKKYIIFLPLFYLFVASPSPDLPVFIIGLISISLFLKDRTIQVLNYCLILSCLLILIKTISISLLLFYLICLAIEYKSIKLKYLIIPLLLGVLYFIKNLILTGNLIFPTYSESLLSLDYSLPKIVYSNNDLFIKYLVTKLNYIPLEEFVKWDYVEYYKYIFTNLNLYTLIYFISAGLHIIFIAYSIINKNKTLIFLSLALFLKVILFFVVSLQFRFILDGCLIILFIIIYKFNLNLRLISIATISLSLSIFIIPILGNNLIYFYKFESNYNLSNLISCKIKSPKVSPYKLGNLDINIVYNQNLSSDYKQPVLNKTLLKLYLYQDMHPQLISPKDVSKGFILIKNDDKMRKELRFLIHKIENYNKTHN